MNFKAVKWDPQHDYPAAVKLRLDGLAAAPAPRSPLGCVTRVLPERLGRSVKV